VLKGYKEMVVANGYIRRPALRYVCDQKGMRGEAIGDENHAPPHLATHVKWYSGGTRSWGVIVGALDSPRHDE